jgi:hypothetical protein
METHSTRTTTCHVLSVFDGDSEELVEIFEIENFSLEAFAVQFDVPDKTDPEMLDRYAVGPDDVRFLEQAIGRPLTFDFSKYGYFIEAARA